jgi:two-component system probable response regulator PhcQ
MNDLKATSPVILFVDDELAALKYFRRAIDSLAPVVLAESVEEGKRMLDKHADTLCILMSDQRMPGKSGNELLRYAKDKYPHIVRILTTAYSELEHTVEAINEGQIQRYIAKPWDISELRLEMRQALEYADLRKERDYLLQEKLMVRRRQMVANRIGEIGVVCASIAGPSRSGPADAYLAAAFHIGVTYPEPDWARKDYSDLISEEAARSGAYGFRVRNMYNDLKQSCQRFQEDHALHIMDTVWEEKSRRAAIERFFF